MASRLDDFSIRPCKGKGTTVAGVRDESRKAVTAGRETKQQASEGQMLIPSNKERNGAKIKTISRNTWATYLKLAKKTYPSS